MLARLKEPPWFWRFFGAGASATLLLPIASAPFDPGWAAARPWQLLLLALAAAWLFAARLSPRALLEAAVPRWAERALLAAGLAFFVACQVTMFEALRVNGIDFSIFDWMIHSAHQGRGMFSPIYGVNHLGVHQTWLLYLWVPLHALLDSPWWLVLSNAAVLWLGVFPLRGLARALGVSSAIAFLAAFAYLTNPWLGRLLDGSFRPESLYPAAGLTLALAWVQRRPWPLALAAALYLGVKEDAALHLLGLAAGALVFARARWREALGLGAAAAAVLALNLGWVQPSLLAPYGYRRPTYLSFWGQYGNGLLGIAAAMASSPWRVVWDIVHSSWFKFFLPALGLPLLARVPAAAMAPVIFLLGTSGNPTMSDYRGYYPLPLLAFALWGLLEIASRPKPGWRWAAAAALAAFPTFGGGYAHPVRLEQHGPAVAALRARVEAKPELVCTQTILFPHLGYRANLVELSAECMADPRSLTVLHPELSPWPFRKEQLVEWIATAEAAQGVERLAGGFLVIGPPASRDVAPHGEPGGHRQ